MKEKVSKILKNKNKTLPILSFPSVSLLKTNVRELLFSSEMQVKGMKAILDNCPIGASLNMMDLSIEAEAFGAKIRFYDNDIPTVEAGIIQNITEAQDLSIPAIGTGRTEIAINAIRQAKKSITDIPVFCGVIGPYSLAGRIFDITELMMSCFENPDDVKILISKATEFIISYIKAFKDAGADGVILAEPVAGLLSPSQAQEFSMPFVKEIFDAVTEDSFILCYHNCGNSVNDMLNAVGNLGADIVHLGNAIDLKKALNSIPSDTVVMGNINPVLFRTSTPCVIKAEIQKIFDECCQFENFMISTGCDVSPQAKWENIFAYFEKINELYTT